jgi:hypothetical protein
LQPAVGPCLVVMVDVLSQHAFKMASTQHDQPIKALAANASHPALGVTIRDRHLYGRADHSHALGRQDVLDRKGKLLVVIAEEDPDGQSQFLQSPAQVAHLLAYPGLIGIGRDTQAQDPSPAELYKEKDV